jgi:hypothetical protein
VITGPCGPPGKHDSQGRFVPPKLPVCSRRQNGDFRKTPKSGGRISTGRKGQFNRRVSEQEIEGLGAVLAIQKPTRKTPTAFLPAAIRSITKDLGRIDYQYAKGRKTRTCLSFYLLRERPGKRDCFVASQAPRPGSRFPAHVDNLPEGASRNFRPRGGAGRASDRVPGGGGGSWDLGLSKEPGAEPRRREESDDFQSSKSAKSIPRFSKEGPLPEEIRGARLRPVRRQRKYFKRPPPPIRLRPSR